MMIHYLATSVLFTAASNGLAVPTQALGLNAFTPTIKDTDTSVKPNTSYVAVNDPEVAPLDTNVTVAANATTEPACDIEVHQTVTATCSPPNTTSYALSNGTNQVVGTWLMQNATQSTLNGSNTQPLGTDPVGYLIFTPPPDCSFAEVFNARNLPLLPDGQLSPGTPEQDAEIVLKTQGNAGLYWVDEDGAFAGQVTNSSTLPNFVGASTTLDTLNLTRVGAWLHEVFLPAEGVRVDIWWKKLGCGCLEGWIY